MDAAGQHQQALSPQKLHSPTSSLDEGSGDAELRGLGLEDVAFEDQDELGPEDALDEQDGRCNEGDDTLRPMEQPEDMTIELPKKTSVISHSRSSSVASQRYAQPTYSRHAKRPELDLGEYQRADKCQRLSVMGCHN